MKAGKKRAGKQKAKDSGGPAAPAVEPEDDVERAAPAAVDSDSDDPAAAAGKGAAVAAAAELFEDEGQPDEPDAPMVLVPTAAPVVVRADVPKVRIYRVRQGLRIWDVDAAHLVRTEYRIYGSLVGSLPTQPQQNVAFSLPLQLSHEEATVLVEAGAAELYDDVDGYGIPTDEDTAAIIEGNRIAPEPLASKATDAVVPTTEVAESAEMDLGENAEASHQQQQQQAATQDSRPHYVRIPTSSGNLPFHRPRRIALEDLKFPQTEQERLRLAVFRDLWQRGYYMTSAAKFGGDYLVYPGDPNRYHAHYVAFVQRPNVRLTPLQFVSFGRLATTVKKTFLVCSQRSDGSIQYISIEWTGMN